MFWGRDHCSEHFANGPCKSAHSITNVEPSGIGPSKITGKAYVTEDENRGGGRGFGRGEGGLQTKQDILFKASLCLFYQYTIKLQALMCVTN